MTELVLDGAAAAADATGVGIGVIIAANRTKHPLEARTLARLAAQYAGRGVTGFGLSNDERRGAAPEFAPAFKIAERAGLLLVPHGGELAGRPAWRPAWTPCTRTGSAWHPGRRGSRPGQAAGRRGRHLRGVPVLQRRARRRGDPVAAPAAPPVRGRRAGRARGRHPLLFGPRLTAQYEIARHAHRFTDAELADLARASALGSAAPEPLRAELLTGIGDWLATVPEQTSGAGFPAGARSPAGARRRGRVTHLVRSA